MVAITAGCDVVTVQGAVIRPVCCAVRMGDRTGPETGRCGWRGLWCRWRALR
nr:hypothetical protein [Epibacterium ulvae]